MGFDIDTQNHSKTKARLQNYCKRAMLIDKKEETDE